MRQWYMCMRDMSVLSKYRADQISYTPIVIVAELTIIIYKCNALLMCALSLKWKNSKITKLQVQTHIASGCLGSGSLQALHNLSRALQSR